MAMTGAEKTRRYEEAVVSKVCVECGRQFKAMRRLKAICSEKCKAARRSMFRPQTMKACKQCRKQFGPVDRLDVQFCSQSCKIENQKGTPAWNAGRKCPQLNRAATRQCLKCSKEFRATKDFSERRQIYCSHRCYLANRRVSHFENSVFEFLARSGVKCDRTVRVGKWTFDGRIAGTNILIEADGRFWHSGEVVKERDARKDAWCRDNCWELIRVKELEFRDNNASACSVAVARWESLTGQKAQRETP